MQNEPVMRLDIDATTYLKGLEEGEADALFALTHANRAYLREWLPWLDSTKTPEDTRAFILATQFHADHKKSYTFGLWVEGRLIGILGTHPVDWPNYSASIGYWLEASSQGRGHVTAACRRLISYLIEELHIHRVEIRCGTGNAKSRAVPQRLGFREEGVAKDGEWVNDHFVDLHVYAMLAPDWPNTPIHSVEKKN